VSLCGGVERRIVATAHPANAEQQEHTRTRPNARAGAAQAEIVREIAGAPTLYRESIISASIRYIRENGSSPFKESFDRLGPVAAARITAAQTRLRQGNTSSVRWFSRLSEYSSIGGLRFRYDQCPCNLRPVRSGSEPRNGAAVPWRRRGATLFGTWRRPAPACDGAGSYLPGDDRDTLRRVGEPLRAIQYSDALLSGSPTASSKFWRDAGSRATALLFDHDPGAWRGLVPIRRGRSQAPVPLTTVGHTPSWPMWPMS
jgi:hypothetical protein